MTLGRPGLPEESSAPTVLLSKGLRLSSKGGRWQHFLLLWRVKAEAAGAGADRWGPSTELEKLCAPGPKRSETRCSAVMRRLIGHGCYRHGSGAERRTRLTTACIVAGNRAYQDFLALNPRFKEK